MLGNLSPLAKIESILSKLNTKALTLNSTLPVNIDVKERLEPQKYRVKVGKKEFTTKSKTKLNVGKKYWASIKGGVGSKPISLSQLLQKPPLLQNSKGFMPRFSFEELEVLMQEERPKESLKLILLEKMSQASSRQEFLALTNMVQAIHNNIFSMLLSYGNEETLLQFKKRKQKKTKTKENALKEETELDFYAAFEHLGPVEGVVEVINGERKLSLYLYYENSLTFLQKELVSLNFEGNVYQKKGKITPLYEYAESLLDLKG